MLEPLAKFADVAARLDEVEKQFDSVAQGKPYLTPAMLQHLLTSRFGIFFDDGELHEAMLSLDSSGMPRSVSPGLPLAPPRMLRCADSARARQPKPALANIRTNTTDATRVRVTNNFRLSDDNQSL